MDEVGFQLAGLRSRHASRVVLADSRDCCSFASEVIVAGGTPFARRISCLLAAARLWGFMRARMCVCVRVCVCECVCMCLSVCVCMCEVKLLDTASCHR